jgi:hypothetical protein
MSKSSVNAGWGLSGADNYIIFNAGPGAQSEKAVQDYGAMAREGKVGMAEMTGGNFTISVRTRLGRLVS